MVEERISILGLATLFVPRTVSALRRENAASIENKKPIIKIQSFDGFIVPPLGKRFISHKLLD
ncbi:hypothetical protein ES703_73279 [subsurface metagenome]